MAGMKRQKLNGTKVCLENAVEGKAVSGCICGNALAFCPHDVGPTDTHPDTIAARTWDATPRMSASQTPRTDRRGGQQGPDFTPNMREWEEEQVKLDRDWYENEGGVVSDHLIISFSLSVLEASR